MRVVASSLLGLLLLSALATQAQFYYSPNPAFGSNNDTVTITGYYGPDGAVSIPATINGLAVTGIGEDAFLEEIGVNAVTIPASVTSIGVGAFSASGLTSVTIPGNVASIGAEAFANCASLTNAILAEGISGIGASAFDSCLVLTNIVIPGSVLGIGPYAFNECSGLTNATISEGVLSIGDGAFYHCDHLLSANIPGSVISIGEEAFNSCFSLRGITVEAQNSIYSSVGGVLFDKSATSLVEAPSVLAGNFTIPDSVTSIGDGAFSQCGSLNSVLIPNTVTNIGAYAFYNCGDLTSVTIAGRVTSIGEYAFFSCAQLTSVYFGGDAPMADSTLFLGDNGPPGPGATVYYLPGTSGWSSSFAGRPTALWQLPYPVILNNAATFGARSNTFGFTISWATNASLAVEASSDLAGSVWTPLQTVTLTNGSFYFSEPLPTNGSSRFYRLRAP